MNLFNIIGPVMIGPSSSHTAGACRIGYISRALLGQDVKSADIGLHGSFAKTYVGHGTDRAVAGGLQGMRPKRRERRRHAREQPVVVDRHAGMPPHPLFDLGVLLGRILQAERNGGGRNRIAVDVVRKRRAEVELPVERP